jgi:lysophospholipase L1-like esterase
MEGCLCADPLVPTNRIKDQEWNQAHLANNEAAVAHWARTLDVVFYGDSITEGWNETNYGKSSTRFAGAKDVFQSLFSTARGGDYEGIALGIAGDAVRDTLPKEGPKGVGRL